MTKCTANQQVVIKLFNKTTSNLLSESFDFTEAVQKVI